MDANTPAKNKWRHWARQYGCCLGDENEQPASNKPIPLEPVADSQNTSRIPPASNNIASHANGLPTSSSSPEAPSTIQSRNQQGNIIQANGESSLDANPTSPDTSGAVAIEGTNVCAGPQDVTRLGSSEANKTNLWGKALSEIQKSQDAEIAEAVKIFVQTLDDSRSEPLESAREIQKQMQKLVTTKEANTESEAWTIRIGQKEYRAREYFEKTTAILENFASSMNKFMGSVDVAVSFDPVHAALPWAAVRLVLTAVIAVHEFKGRVALGLAKVAVLISQCHIYQRFYMTSEISTELDKSEFDSLEEAIVDAYTHSILFLIFVHKQSKSKMLAVSASWKRADMEEYFENLKYADDGLIRTVNNCQRALANKTGDKVRQVVELLGDFGTEIHKQRELIVDIRQKKLLFQLKCADGAAYDSLADQNEPRCHKETRIKLLGDVQAWMDNSDEKPIFWLQGIAGTGKSTISRTVAKNFDAKGKLGASFFFKRGRGDRSSGSRFFTTISSQLCRNRSLFAQSVAKAIDEDRGVLETNSQKQFNKLILEPLKSMATDPNTRGSILVVVDALDECKDDHVQFMIQSLAEVRKLREVGIDLRLFITSRPEVHIRREFREILDCHKEVVLHDISSDVVQEDIAIYLKDELSSIIKQHKKDLGECRQPVDETWPSDESIQRLANMSTPLFIVAATVCRLLDCDEPYNVFSHILSQGEKPYDEVLDAAYCAALGRVLKGKENSSGECRIVTNFRVVVGSIVLLEEPLSIPALAQLLGTSPETVSITVTSIGSVLNIPKDNKTPVKTFHLSFREFLINKQRNTIAKLQIDEDETHNDLANKCLELLLKSSILKNDVCGLGKLDKRNCDVPQNIIDEKISTQVQYACRYWVHHMKKSKVKLHDKHLAYKFLKKHFLHWLEVLSLTGRLPESIGLIRELREFVDPNSGEKLSKFLHDANRFILHSIEAINQTPLQLYSSALLFAPRQSIVRQLFEGDISWVLHKPLMEEDWSPCLQTIHHQSNWGGSVAVSGNGKLIAHGGKEKAVKIWDATTGVLQKSHECEDEVESVVFCHDDELIAARSRNGAINIWNAATGRLQRTLRADGDGSPQDRALSLASSISRLIASASGNGIIEIFDASTGLLHKAWKGHEMDWRRRIAVSFSGGGRLVASGREGTIKIWDATTGELQHTLTSAGRSILSLAFSSDGSLLASASHHKTIQIWDTATWKKQSTLRGHTSPVKAVAFSSDSILLASASYDYTIKIWDLATRTLQRTLTGHNASVSSIAFPEANLLVSASSDQTIKIWDLTQANPQHTFESHTEKITSIEFSTNNRLVASGSYDKTVKVWDATTGSLKYTLQGHTQIIDSVALSADSKLIASGSQDTTVKVWDATTGSLKYTLKGHTRGINSVAFSADSKLVASGSYDKTIKVWDATTGSLKYTLKGHTEIMNAVAFSADSKLVASGSYDKTVKVWDATTGSLKYTLKGHDYSIKSVAFSADSRLIASGSHDIVKVWDAKDAIVKITLCLGLGQSYSYLSFADTNSLVLQGPGHSMIDINAILERGEAQAVVHIDDKTGSSTNNLLETKSPPQNGVALQPRGCGLSPSNEWITWKGQPVVWLPPSYRPRLPSVISASSEMIAIGSVRPCFIGDFEKWWT